MTEELNHILEGQGGAVDPTNARGVGRVSPVPSGRVSPIVGDRTTSVSSIHTTGMGMGTRRHGFTIGDQVYITNHITHSVSPGPLDQAAIVT